MKKLSTKWKLFYGANLYLFTAAMIMLFTTVQNFIETWRATDKFDNTILFLVIIVLFSMLVNSLLNLYLLNHFFPDKTVRKKIKLVSLVFFYLNIVCWILLVITFIAMLTIAKDYNSNYIKPRFIIGMVLLGLVVISLPVVLILQFKLPREILNNSKMQMSLLIDSIGQPLL